jgi:hypothetical protein
LNSCFWGEPPSEATKIREKEVLKEEMETFLSSKEEMYRLKKDEYGGIGFGGLGWGDIGFTDVSLLMKKDTITLRKTKEWSWCTCWFNGIDKARIVHDYSWIPTEEEKLLWQLLSYRPGYWRIQKKKDRTRVYFIPIPLKYEEERVKMKNRETSSAPIFLENGDMIVLVDNVVSVFDRTNKKQYSYLPGSIKFGEIDTSYVIVNRYQPHYYEFTEGKNNN